MDTELTYLAWTVVLAIVQLLSVAVVFTGTNGLSYGMSSRDQPPPKEMPPVGGRLKRAFGNLMETFPLAVAAILAAHVAGRHGSLVTWGATLYFWGRVIYFPVYAAGIPVVRTLIWSVSMLGIVLVLLGLT